MSVVPNEPEQTKASRAKRSLHPGVKIKAPSARARMAYYRAVYVDPESGKEKYVKLDSAALPTAKARQQWAIRKSVALRQRKAELDAGAPRATGIGWDEAFDLFYENAPDLREKTTAGYKTATENFKTWAVEANVAPDTITRAKLMLFRAWAHKLPMRRMMKGGKRGEKVELNKRRSAFTVNSDIRGVRRALGWLVAASRLPKLSLEDLKVALKKFTTDHSPPEFLSPVEIRKTLEACTRHDSKSFRLTREEKKRLGQRRTSEAGATPRHPTISPLVLAAFLTGMRLDELCLIEWRTHIELDATDFDGKVIGQIKLRAEDTKTHRARNVSFEVSPLLRDLFLALRRMGSGKGSVFGVTYDEAQEANQRLRDECGAPDRFTYQMARSSCSTYLTNAPAIYGAAAPFHSAKQLGHSQKVAEDHYTGLIKGMSRDIKTLEAAMQIEKEGRAIVNRILGIETRDDNVVSLGR